MGMVKPSQDFLQIVTTDWLFCDVTSVNDWIDARAIKKDDGDRISDVNSTPTNAKGDACQQTARLAFWRETAFVERRTDKIRTKHRRTIDAGLADLALVTPFHTKRRGQGTEALQNDKTAGLSYPTFAERAGSASQRWCESSIRCKKYFFAVSYVVQEIATAGVCERTRGVSPRKKPTIPSVS